MFQALTRQRFKRTSYLPSIGEYSTGESMLIDPLDLKHVLITGSTRGGKSSYINSMINVLQYFDTTLYGVDCKRLELKPWSNVFQDIAVDISGVLPVLEAVNNVMNERLDYLDSQGLRKWPSKDRIVLVIDEMHQALAVDYSLDDKEAKADQRHRMDLLTRIAQLGLASGVHLILSTQTAYHDQLPGQLKNNLDVRICCKVNSPEMLKSGLGFSHGLDHQAIPPYPGSAYIVGLPDCLFQPRIGRAYWVET